MINMLSKVKVDAAIFHIAALATAVFLLLLIIGDASAATITVDDSSGVDYNTIQTAVDNASAEDVNCDTVADVLDCTYLAWVIAGVLGYSV